MTAKAAWHLCACRLAPAAALHQFINARIGAFQSGVARRAAAHAADSRCAPARESAYQGPRLFSDLCLHLAAATSSPLRLCVCCRICLLSHPLAILPQPTPSSTTPSLQQPL